jgi:FlaG/FlaF family flagellin (archaellin)
MKKMLTVIAVFAGVMIYAGDLKVNGEFKPGKAGVPVGWVQNKGAWAKPFGKVELVPSSKEGQKALKITNTSKSTHVYINNYTPVKLGDTVEIQVKVKGRGKGSIGFYNYNSKKWLGTRTGTFKATPKFTEVKKVLKVTKFKENAPIKIRIVLIVNTEAEITFEDLQVKVISAK